METTTWNCCRLCLSDQSLHPIFSVLEHKEKYSEVLFAVTGIKVEPTDDLPQQICSPCITFINKSTQFRLKCNRINQELISKRNQKDFIKDETLLNDLKRENEFSINIDHLVVQSIKTCLIDNNSGSVWVDIPENGNFEYNLPSVEKIENDMLGIETENMATQKVASNRKRKKENDLKKELSEFVQVKNVVRKRRKVSCKEIIETENSNGKTKRTVKRVSKNNSTDKIETENSEKTKESIECEYCHKVLTSRLSLRNHYKIHTGFDVVCEHCGKKFITRRLLLMHCRAKHGYEKTDKCSYCDYRASNAEQVKIHERLHTGERPYVCAECGAGFHRKSSYLQHVAIHLPEKTVQCDQCPARFKSVTLMRIHRNRHRAAQYTFQCTVCRNSFARRRNAARHLQRVHQMPPESNNIERHKIT